MSKKNETPEFQSPYDVPHNLIGNYGEALFGRQILREKTPQKHRLSASSGRRSSSSRSILATKSSFIVHQHQIFSKKKTIHVQEICFQTFWSLTTKNSPIIQRYLGFAWSKHPFSTCNRNAVSFRIFPASNHLAQVSKKPEDETLAPLFSPKNNAQKKKSLGSRAGGFFFSVVLV